MIASFALAGPTSLDGNLSGGQFTKVVEKGLSPGSWVVFSTASAVRESTGSFGGDDLKQMVMECQLRNAEGGIIGASRAAGTYTQFQRDSAEITVNGGIFVGDGGNVVSLWCRAEFGSGSLDGAQMMVLNIGGFTN